MKLIALVVVLFSLPILHAEEGKQRELIQTLKQDSTVMDNELMKDQSVFHFQFKGEYDANQQYILDYSVDGKVFKVTLDQSLSITIPVKFGKHQFQFYCHNINTDFKEVQTGNLNSELQMHHYYSVYLVEAGRIIMVKKPVIYCYPLVKQEVSIKLKVNGDLVFTYPKYENGWNFVAEPNGKLECKGSNYNYLFWESTYQTKISIDKSNVGFCVAQEGVLSFLEEKLTSIGFTSTEKADFITYWGPQMIQNKFAVVRFVENEACNEFAELDINPKPDHVNRFYILWSPSNSKVELAPQKLTPMNREGFTILEWGGQELPIHLF